MLVSIGKTAKLLGVNVRTLRNWHSNGKFIPVKFEGGANKRYYSKEQIKNYLGEAWDENEFNKIIGM